jgi:TolB-like protein/Tfp pilus assembly protein PilF
VGDFLQRLKQRKLVQWAIAYVAFAFALLQGLDIVAQRFDWPGSTERYLILALALGFFVVLVLAWYHGELGAQHIGGTELLIIALLLAIGGGLIWRLGPAAAAKPGASAGNRNPAVAAANVHAQPPSASSPTSPGAAAAGDAAQAIPAKSIAVLPFDNLTVDKDNAYFVTGMQDLILTKLADIGDLKVISRTSTEKYASHPDNLKTIGQQLGVATLLEGSVQKVGDQVLINVQLIDAKSDSHIWAQSYQRTLDNVFGVEGEVAEKIATALKARLSPAEARHLATSLSADNAANDLFLRAEYQANQGLINYDTASWKLAIPLYRQAIRRDPDFALAYARLSHVQSELAWFGGGGLDVKSLIADARRNAEQALKLAPHLTVSQLALGYSEYWGRGDYAAALKAFAEALRSRPNDAETLAAQGFVERRQGRLDDAMASLQQAFALDPRNSSLAFALGTTYAMTSRYPDAERWYQRALALDPNNRNAKIYLSNAIVFATGDIPRALATVAGDQPFLKLQRVTLLTWQRQCREALALLDSVPDGPDNFGPAAGGGPKSLWQAELHRLLGDVVHARALYTQVLQKIRPQLAAQQGIDQAFVWKNIATAELGLTHIAPGLDAIAKAQAIVGRSSDQMYGPAVMYFNATLYAEADRPDLAVPLLATALASPGIGVYYSPVLLWLDPAWDPIRHDPRFQALLQQYARDKPDDRFIATAPGPAATHGGNGS